MLGEVSCCCQVHECLPACVQVGEHNKHGRVLKAEKLTARTTIYPILQAEEDRRHAFSSNIETDKQGTKRALHLGTSQMH